MLAGQVSRGFFELFGMAPLHGRVLRADEDSPGRDGVVVLSYGFFVRRFAADPAVVGRTIRLNQRPHVVVGVMPEAFDYLADNGALWVPIAFTPEQEAQHDEHYLTVFGRLAPGVTWGQAQDRLVAVARDLEKRFPKEDAGISARVTPYTEWLVEDVRLRLFTWLGAVACVLLIACANVANLLLARGTGRARELAVRASLGASRWRIVRQLLAESLVLSAAGALGGVAIARWATQLLAVSGPISLPRIFQASVDGTVLAFAVALTVASAVIFGLVPALRAARTDLQGVMREGGRRSGSGVARDGMRTALVAAEVALAVTLIVGAGLLLRAAWHLQRVALGFEPAGVLTARVTLPDGAYPTGERVLQAFEAMVERLRATPGVTAAGFTSQVPMGPGGNGNGLLPAGRPRTPENLISSRLRIVSPGIRDDAGAVTARASLHGRRSARRAARDDHQRVAGQGGLAGPGSDRQADAVLRGEPRRSAGQDRDWRRRRRPIVGPGRRGAARVLSARGTGARRVVVVDPADADAGRAGSRRRGGPGRADSRKRACGRSGPSAAQREDDERAALALAGLVAFQHATGRRRSG